MTYALNEPTIDELLADPLINALMRADGVDARELAALLRSVARQIGGQTPRRPDAYSLSRSRSLPRPHALPARLHRDARGCLSSW